MRLTGGLGWLFGALLILRVETPLARAASLEVAQAETKVSLDAGVMHTQYHENISPGDDESGYLPGFGFGASALLPLMRGWNPDLYTALDYDFNAGNLHYSGHYLLSDAPATATDNAVFNRVEAKIGLGFQLPGIGSEIIPFIAGGYQAWNRNVGSRDASSDEFYHSGMIGGGLRLDLPLTASWVATFDGEALGLIGGGITNSNFNLDQSFGTSGSQRVSLGLDDAFDHRFHFTGTLFWQHFTYSGSKPQIYDFIYVLHEPSSSTGQFGASLGIAYSFY